MNKCILTIQDTEDAIDFSGHIEDPEAIDKDPTPALIVMSYLAANHALIVRDAMIWADKVNAPGVIDTAKMI